MFYNKQPGVPCFECAECEEKKNEYVDIVICDGDSTDGCTEERRLRELGVNSLLIKKILENKVLN